MEYMTLVLEYVKVFLGSLPKEAWAPLATVTAAIIAFTAMLKNTSLITQNLRIQLAEQAKENEKKLRGELYLSEKKEKVAKLEEIHELLHSYIYDTQQYMDSTLELILTSTEPKKELGNFIGTLIKNYTPIRKNLTKSKVLATAYIDSLDEEFDNIQENEDIFINYLKILSVYLFREKKSDPKASEAESYQRKKAKSAIENMHRTAKDIDNKIIAQIKSLTFEAIEN